MADNRVLIIAPGVSTDIEPEINRIEALYAHPGEQVRLNGGRFMLDTDETVAQRETLYGGRALTVSELRLDREGVTLRVNYRFEEVEGLHNAMYFDRGEEGVTMTGTLIRRDDQTWFHPMIERTDERGAPINNEFGEALTDPADKARLVHPEFTRAAKWSLGLTDGERDGISLNDFNQMLEEKPSSGTYHFIERPDGTLQIDFTTFQTPAMAIEVALAERAIDTTRQAQAELASQSPGASVNGITLGAGVNPAQIDMPRVEALYAQPGEKVVMTPGQRFAGESPEDLAAREAMFNSRLLTVTETRVESRPADEGTAMIVQYRFAEVEGSHTANGFQEEGAYSAYGVLIGRGGQMYFQPLDPGPDEGGVHPDGQLRRITEVTRSGAYSLGEGRIEVLTAEQTSTPTTGEFSFVIKPDGSAKFSFVAWHSTATNEEVRVAEQAIAASINPTQRTEQTSMAEADRQPPQPTSEFDPGNSDTLPNELTYDDWRAHTQALSDQREQEYARDTMEIAQQQARGEMTQAQEINEGVWLIAADRAQRGVFVLNAKSPMANPDRRAVTLPTERGAQPDPFRAAEALWQHYRRSMAQGGLEAAKTLNAAAVAYRQAVAPSGTIEQGATHKNAEQTVHLTDSDNRDRPFTVVAHTEEEARVIRGFMKMADTLLPRDKETLRFASTMSLIPMKDGQPVLPSAKEFAHHFNAFRPRHPAIVAGKETVGVFVSHPHYDVLKPAMAAAHAEGRKIAAIEGAAADRSGAQQVIKKVPHENYVVAAWKTNLELLANADRLVVVWNGKPRDPALHLVANAVRAGKPISVFDGEGRAMDPIAVSRDAIREYPSTRERDAMTLRDDVANLGQLGSPVGQVFLKAMGFSPENAMKFGLNNIHGQELAAALGSAEHLAKLAARAKIPSPALRPFNENAQRVQAAMNEAKVTMAVCEQKGVEVITPFASDHFPKKLAPEFPVLFVAGDPARLADASARGIIVAQDRASPGQPTEYESYKRPVIAVDGARPPLGDRMASVIVTAGDIAQVAKETLYIERKAVVSTEPPAMDGRSIDVVAMAKTSPAHVGRSVHLATSLANGVLVADTKIDGIGRQIVDSALSKGKAVAIEDPRGTGTPRIESYTHQIRDLLEVKMTIDGKANLAEAMKNNPDHENVVEKLRREDRRQLRDESVAISTMTPAQVQQMNRTAALVTVIPVDPKFGPAMEKIFLSKAVDRSEPAPKRVAAASR